MAQNTIDLDRTIKQVNLRSSHPKVSQVIERSGKEWGHLSESQLETLQSILSRFDDFAELLSTTNMHPTLDVLLQLNKTAEGIARLHHILLDRNQYQRLLILLLQTSIYEPPPARASSATFIATMQLSQDKLDELNHLVTNCEAAWNGVFQNRLRLEDLFNLNLNADQRATLHNVSIQDLMMQTQASSLCDTLAQVQTQPTPAENTQPNVTAPSAATHPIQQLIKMIDAYTKRIDENKTTKKYSKFESDFCFMNKSRGANRKATYDALVLLRAELVGVQNCELAQVPEACRKYFSDQHIESLRPSVAEPYTNRGINSVDVKRLLKAGKEFADSSRNFSRT